MNFKNNKMGISGSALKIIAMAVMVIDHIASYLLVDNSFCRESLFSVGSVDFSIYDLMRGIGRVAFPIFCFLLVEGFHYTHNRLKYGLMLLLFAFISEIPFDLLDDTKSWFEVQNVFFTLALGYFSIWLLDYWEKDLFNRCVIVMISLMLSIFIRVDYNIAGLFLILVLYLARERFWLKMLLGCALLPMPVWSFGSAMILKHYNGYRGFVKGKYMKYLFYIFYPFHLFLIYLIKIFV